MFDVCILNAGPIEPPPQSALPLSPVDRIVNAEMQRITPLFRLGILTPMDIRDALYLVAYTAREVKG